MAERPVVLVTGATGGMGRLIVADLARDRDVIAVGRNEAGLAALAEEHGVRTWQLDLAALARGQAPGVAWFVEGLDRLDGLVHVAAVGGHWSADEATLERWHEQFDTNVIAPAELTRLTLPLLRRAQGHVVFIGSGASRVPVPGSVIYAPSKHALRAYAEALRDDESPHRVRVTSLEPGPTATDMGPRRAPAEALIQPASVAAAVRFALDSPPDVDITVVAVRPRVELNRL